MMAQPTRDPWCDETRAPLPSMRLVPPPVRPRRIAFALAGAFVAFFLLALLSPWRQNVRGNGRVVAYAPLERRQNVEAPIDGRVVEWFVQEGTAVRAGDPIVRLSDNDPNFVDRLVIEQDAAKEQLRAYGDRVAAQRARLEAVTRAQESALASRRAQVEAAEQAVSAATQSAEAAEAAWTTARRQRERQEALRGEGLVSERELELGVLAEARARTDRDAAQAALLGARSTLASRQAELRQAEAQREAEIESARASVQAAESEAAAGRASLARLESRMARQATQLVVAPRDGVVFRLVASQGEEQVGAGETLAILVPDARRRAVELWVDGNDAALISQDRHVRLQFEGWPAVQFAGWPSAAVGTFGGRVAFVDATDDGRGNFRLLVVPDEGDTAWPEARFLRQGTRVHGWVLLERVSLAFELWRLLNGFPPVLDEAPQSGAPSEKAGGDSRKSPSGGSS